MSEKCKKTHKYLNYIEHSLIWASAVAGFISIYVFTLLVSLLVGITRSAVGLKICTITAGIKNYKIIIEKKKKKHDKIVFSGKTKLDTIEVLTSNDLIDSYINHYKFVSINNVLREYDKMKREIKNSKNSVE